MKQIVYYKIDWSGFHPLDTIMVHKCFEDLSVAIAYIEEKCAVLYAKYLSGDNRQVLYHYEHITRLGNYYHYVVFVEDKRPVLITLEAKKCIHYIH